MANEPMATSQASPIPLPATPKPRTAVAFQPRKAGTDPLEKLKGYLKEVPGLHHRLTLAVTALEAQAQAGRKALADFEATTSEIKAVVAKWEEEQTHAGNGHHGPGSAGADPDAGPTDTSSGVSTAPSA